ncbi:MAG: LPS assembly lipoprotein LptE [Burkholderiaceae bacterium]
MTPIPTRRHWLISAAGAVGAATLLVGCGVRLRGAQTFAFDSIYIVIPDASGLGNELRRQLASNGKLRVIRDAKEAPKAQVVLESLQDQRERTVVGLTAAGQVREFQLRVRFRFRLRTPAGKELIPDTEILQQRDVSFSETTALASEQKDSLVYRDMQSDVVQQVLRRLAAVRL